MFLICISNDADSSHADEETGGHVKEDKSHADDKIQTLQVTL